MIINNKVVIITGASQGIGKATAKVLAHKGAKVVLAARSAVPLKKLAGELTDALAVPTDMRKPADIKKLISATVKKYGRVDILINNAGQGMYGPVEKIDIKDYEKVFDLNVSSVIRAMQGVIPQMRKQGGGMIVNVSSLVSKNYFTELAAYASTKYALNAISLTARQELEPDHIAVSVMHPKMTATDFGKNAVGERPDWATRGSSGRRMPDVDTPEQVADAIALLIESEEPEAQM